MPLTPKQIKLVHMAKTACDLEDAEYREVWTSLYPGITSSKDRGLGDEHFDKFMKYVEAIYWRANQKPCKVFSRPFFWAERNTAASTTRDRFSESQVREECRQLEGRLLQMGFTHGYCNAIAKRVLPANATVNDWFKLRNALSRTVANKAAKLEDETCPF